MNRTIKFRVWVETILPEENGMYFPIVMQLHAGGADKVWTDGYKFTSDTAKFTLMQFTGQQDKSGTDIYEGDILKRDGELFQVRYGVTTAAFVWKRINSTDPKQSAPLRNGEQYEVVGNVYETPELLK